MTLYELKIGYIASMRHFFPESTVHLTVLSNNGKTHPHFMDLMKILSTNNIDPRSYIPFVFSRAEKPPTVRQLTASPWITQYQHAHKKEE